VYCSSIVFRRIWRYQREVIRIRKSKKDRERNDKKKTNKKTNNKQQSIKHTHKTKDRVTRTPLKTWGERRCSGKVGSSCYTSATRRANLVTNPVISHEWGKTGKCIRQIEHIRCNLWHIYSITVNHVMYIHAHICQYLREA